MFRRVSIVGLLLLFGASVNFAQITARDFSKAEVFGGYSNNQVDVGISDDNNDFRDFFKDRKSFNGFNISATGNFNRYVGVRGDFSAHFRDFDFDARTTTGTTTVDRFRVDASLYNFLGGVQVKDNSREGSRLRPFAYGMVGVATSKTKLDSSFFNSSFCRQGGIDCNDFRSSQTSFAAGVGGGIDIKATRRFSIRAFQFDYNPTRFSDSTQNNFRFGAGVVIH